jgi:RsbT co-antagonist protein rsbRD N-terminal domain
MISIKLVQMIESHSDQIADGVLERLRKDLRARHMAGLPETELRDACHRVLRNLGHSLTASSQAEIAQHYEERGRVRANKGVPLHEAVLFLITLKETMLDYIRHQGLARSAVHLYAEGELEHQIGGFFDSATFHLIRGYESIGLQVATASV